MELSSPSFEDGEEIPERFTCEGENVSPALTWSSEPEGTVSLALIVHDPDAPSGDFVHWLAWNLDPKPGELTEGMKDVGSPLAVEGVNSWGRTGYGGPCPPPGHGPHRYLHELYAVDRELDLHPGAGREQLEAALEGHVLAEARVMGTYERA